MERAKYFCLITLFAYSFVNVEASHKADIYKAYLSSDMTSWKKIMDQMDRQNNKSNAFILELLNYQYGYVAWCIAVKKDEEAEEYLKKGKDNISILEKNGYEMSWVEAYKSAFYGYRIGLAVYQAPFLGPKSVDCARQAMKLDARNPFGYIQYGNSQYYMPAIFGGSKTVAIEYYEKARKLMELDQERIKEDWNYLNLLSMIAMAYEKTEQYHTAKVCYEKILKIAPDFLWVKNKLYPELLEKIN